MQFGGKIRGLGLTEEFAEGEGLGAGPLGVVGDGRVLLGVEEPAGGPADGVVGVRVRGRCGG